MEEIKIDEMNEKTTTVKKETPSLIKKPLVKKPTVKKAPVKKEKVEVKPQVKPPAQKEKIEVKEDNTDNYNNKDIGEMPNILSVKGKLLHIKVGNNSNPSSTEALKDVEAQCLKLLENFGMDCAILVTDHCVEIKVVE
jgi:hypothetical protein